MVSYLDSLRSRDKEFIALKGSREVRRGGKQPNTRCILEPVTTVGNWNLVLLGSFGLHSRTHGPEQSCELQIKCFSKGC